jgi:hypothetical protein
MRQHDDFLHFALLKHSISGKAGGVVGRLEDGIATHTEVWQPALPIVDKQVHGRLVPLKEGSQLAKWPSQWMARKEL